MFIISALEAAILGSVQGLTEFLPVSSTAHLILFQRIFGLDQKTYGLSFDMFTNLGTTIALILYFRHDLATLVRRLRWPKREAPLAHAERIPWWILGITVIVGAIGVLLEDKIATSFRSLAIIAVMLIVFGVVMLVAEAQAKKIREKRELDIKSAYSIGLAQILAFVPGVSRSGVTISTGLFFGISRENAARFTFLLSVPITLAAIGKRLITAFAEFKGTPPGGEVIAFYLIGLAAAGIVGYWSIKFLLDYVRKSSLAAFAYYRFALAGVILVWLVIK